MTTSKAWLTELYENRTERAQAARAKITEDVYVEIRKQHGMES